MGQRSADAGRPPAAGAAAAAAGGAVRRAVRCLGCAPGAVQPCLLGWPPGWLSDWRYEEWLSLLICLNEPHACSPATHLPGTNLPAYACPALQIEWSQNPWPCFPQWPSSETTSRQSWQPCWTASEAAPAPASCRCVCLSVCLWGPLAGFWAGRLIGGICATAAMWA